MKTRAATELYAALLWAALALIALAAVAGCDATPGLEPPNTDPNSEGRFDGGTPVRPGAGGTGGKNAGGASGAGGKSGAGGGQSGVPRADAGPTDQGPDPSDEDAGAN